ncbi:MAG: efflux RND transporter periplasmic adaptor subunit, partial [Planctomycetota bacterium]
IIYGSASESWWRKQNNPVRAGAQVRQNQVIMRVPDLNALAAKISIPEADIDKVKVGQNATITMQATPEKPLRGKVVKVSPMASSENRWLNPKSKVYDAEVQLEQVPEGFITGMSATVRIIVAELEDALYIPNQAVTTHKGVAFCWVNSPDGPQLRSLKVGFATGKFVEVKDGLRAGEVVYLAPPEDVEEQVLEERAKAIQEAEPAAEDDQAEEAAAQEPVAEVPKAESEYVTDGQIDWMKIGREMQGVSGEDKGKLWQQILEKLPDDKRKEAEEMASKWQQRSEGGQGGESEGMRPRRGGRPPRRDR